MKEHVLHFGLLHCRLPGGGGVGVGSAYPGSHQMVPDVRVSLEGHEGRLGEDTTQLRVLLQHMEIAQQDVAHREVVGVEGEYSHCPVIAFFFSVFWGKGICS